MAHVREKRGFHTEYVGVKDEGKIIAAAMLSELKVFLGYTLVQALRGFLIDYEDSELLDFFHHELIRFLKARKCMILKIDPYYPYVQRSERRARKGGFDQRCGGAPRASAIISASPAASTWIMNPDGSIPSLIAA
ncbi:MAG: peptidoglycan bridge formation glycyltransferase FemA/FemB family protein [Merdibacter sp.]